MAATYIDNTGIPTLQYRKINNIAGLIIFAIASLTYLLTIEPTASFWDCGEFIASAHKLEVGHPPGAPLFMIAAKVFSLLAGGDVTKVAAMVNSLSALASGFTILFLFWSITYFAQKIINKNEQEYSLPNIIVIIGSGIVGALAYAYSDTFWFSAVEGEVYALSSFFTAIVFWAILKWERISDEKYANRWLILIAYLMGLSIGVHLLNLLAIPAIVLVYYFKKYKTSGLGIFYASVVSILLLGIVMYGIISGVVEVASWFELMFVNKLNLPYNSGILFYLAILLFLIVLGIYITHKFEFVIANTIIISFAVMLLGYSSYAMTVIRSSADTPMNENHPNNVFSLLSYLNREQYGDRPLIYGQYFNAEAVDKTHTYTYVQRKGKYEKIQMTNPDYKYDPKFSTIFPRMYSNQKSHISAYMNWTNIKDATKKPPYYRNLAFFFGYQINHMYIRYFMWNFAGRQNDEPGNGGNLKGNWISGIPFIDALRLGSQRNLPDSIKLNQAHNKYYFFPLILGIIGLIYMYKKQPKQFFIVLLLFIMTGLAIVVYLNQTPYQPRERDYAYAGSFYAFAIYIGLGVMSIAQFFRKFAKPDTAAYAATLICLLLVPSIMAKENWDDHDRSGRYTCRDFAKDYLNFCAKNAILFTYGDNDTFPLWYVQEVEGFRTDVRVVNLSLLGTDWYIDQMKKKAYEADPVPFSYTLDKYQQGKRDLLPVVEQYKDLAGLKDIMNFVASDDPKAKVETVGGDVLNFIPATNMAILVDSLKAVKSGMIKPQLADSIVKAVVFKISNKYLTKSDMMVLDLIANFNWDRPIYFASSGGISDYMNLQDYFRLEGFAYRFVPIKTASHNGDIGYVDTDILYDNLMNKGVWGRMNEPDVLIDENILRVISLMKIREVFYRLADALILEKKNEKAIKVLDKIVELTPNRKVPYDYKMIPIAEAYYRTNQLEKANRIVNQLAEIYLANLCYYLNFKGINATLSSYETKDAVTTLQETINLAEKYKQEKLYDSLSAKYDVLLQKYMQSEQSKAN